MKGLLPRCIKFKMLWRSLQVHMTMFVVKIFENNLMQNIVRVRAYSETAGVKRKPSRNYVEIKNVHEICSIRVIKTS